MHNVRRLESSELQGNQWGSIERQLRFHVGGVLLTCPVAELVVCIWEKVIRLEGPGVVVGMLCSSVGRWSGVEHIEAAILVHIVDQLVHIFVPARQANALNHC